MSAPGLLNLGVHIAAAEVCLSGIFRFLYADYKKINDPTHVQSRQQEIHEKVEPAKNAEVGQIPYHRFNLEPRTHSSVRRQKREGVSEREYGLKRRKRHAQKIQDRRFEGSRSAPTSTDKVR